MRPISFLTPISFDNLPKKTHRQRFIQTIDGYLYLKGKKAYVLDVTRVNRSQPAVILQPLLMTKSDRILLAAKIASYVIFILPILALSCKACMRSLHRFHVHLHNPEIIPEIPKKLSKAHLEGLAAPKSPPDSPIIIQDKPNPIEESPSPPPLAEAPQANNSPNPAIPRATKPAESKKTIHIPVSVRHHPFPREVRETAQDLKNKFTLPKNLLSDLRNRKPKVADVTSMLERGIAIAQTARTLQNQLSLFQGESAAVKKANVMLEKLRNQIAKASEKSKKLTSLYDCWATSMLLEGMFLGKKQAAIDSLSATIEKHIHHLDALIRHA